MDKQYILAEMPAARGRRIRTNGDRVITLSAAAALRYINLSRAIAAPRYPVIIPVR